MKQLYLAGLIALMLCLGGLQTAATPIIQPGARVAIVGDSITEQKLYSRFIELYIDGCMPQLGAHVMQFGWGGDRTGAFVNRMDVQVLPFHPTVATLCFGMNDGNYKPFDPVAGKAYQDPLRKIVEKFKADGTTVVVGSPGAVDTNPNIFRKEFATPAQYNDTLGQLGGLAKAVADEHGMPFANVHDAMLEAMIKAKAVHGEDLNVGGADGVHAANSGHLAMAYAFLKAMGFDGDLGTITIDVNGTATAVNGHTVLSSNGRQVEIESTRYPFCAPGAVDDKRSARAMLPFLPFNQDLNRLTLIVTGVKTARAKVTWGATSQVFTRDDLAKGINLAAEFPDNPFSVPFQQLDRVVTGKQAFETNMIKELICQFPALGNRLPQDTEFAEALKTLTAKLWIIEDQYAAAVRAAVKPVRHTIIVEDVTP